MDRIWTLFFPNRKQRWIQISHPSCFHIVPSLFVFYLHRFGSYFFIDPARSPSLGGIEFAIEKVKTIKKFVCGGKNWGRESCIWFLLLAFNNIKFWIVNRDTNCESQTIRDDSHNSQRLLYIFTIHIEKILSCMKSWIVWF
jgi:hypothetical protein